MGHEQTPAEHARQKAWVQASEMLEPTRAERHGVYRNRSVNRAAPVVFPVAKPMHVFVTPKVREL